LNRPDLAVGKDNSADASCNVSKNGAGAATYQAGALRRAARIKHSRSWRARLAPVN